MKQLHFSAALLLILIFSAATFPQDEEFVQFPIQIDAIEVHGNKRTKKEVLLREIPFDLPAKMELKDIHYIQERLSNLFLFKRVELFIEENNGKNILMIDVAETWYIYPVPVFFLNDQEWDQASYGFQVSHLNFRGMNEQLSIGGWAGFNPAFFIRYNNPWVGKHSRLILGINLRARRVRNKFYDINANRVFLDSTAAAVSEGENIEERHLGGSISLGKRLDLHNSVTATFGMRRIRFDEGLESLSISGDGSDITTRLSLQWRSDYRNLFEYPTKGVFLRYTISKNGFTDQQPDFWRFEFDNRGYLPITSRISIGARNLLRLNRGDLPVYDRVFIGFGDRIRGHFNRRLTAQNLMLQSYELRVNLLPVRFLSWGDAPEATSGVFKDLKYGVSVGAFMDSGVVWDRKEELSIGNHNTGYGLGLHLHLPYIYLLRIEHAWNDDGNREWLILGGVSF